jgi:SAM-dependent methyltransferase
MSTKHEAVQSFGAMAEAYAHHRPRYPRALYDWLLSNCPGRDAAWDCATGNGQAAIDLSPFFARVEASDVSAEQVRAGMAADNVHYSVQHAERTSYGDASFDLVTVAQALHWFDYARFWPEVRRVAKPGALFCAFGYAWVDCEPAIDQALVRPLRALIAPFWAANNRILWEGYRDDAIAFPFERLGVPAFRIEVSWSVPALIAFMRTWSASKRAESDPDTARELDALIENALATLPHWPAPMAMPLTVVAGRIV